MNFVEILYVVRVEYQNLLSQDYATIDYEIYASDKDMAKSIAKTIFVNTHVEKPVRFGVRNFNVTENEIAHVRERISNVYLDIKTKLMSYGLAEFMKFYYEIKGWNFRQSPDLISYTLSFFGFEFDFEFDTFNQQASIDEERIKYYSSESGKTYLICNNFTNIVVCK